MTNLRETNIGPAEGPQLGEPPGAPDDVDDLDVRQQGDTPPPPSQPFTTEIYGHDDD